MELFLAKARDSGLDTRNLRVYLSELAGYRRYGVIYGDYVSRKEAVRAINLLPEELKKSYPYPRQAIRLKPNSNTKPAN